MADVEIESDLLVSICLRDPYPPWSVGATHPACSPAHNFRGPAKIGPIPPSGDSTLAQASDGLTDRR
jgi:hypothetical protein